jgi:hypothetical protein
MNSVKRGDIVGVQGFPGKSKKGELSVFPTSMQVGGWVGSRRSTVMGGCELGACAFSQLTLHDTARRCSLLDAKG